MNTNNSSVKNINIFFSNIASSVVVFFFILLMNAGCKTSQGNKARKGNIETVLKLDIGINNPRNSEGDFVRLKNGKILFIYTHFTGNSGSDYGTAYLASRISDPGGKTWSIQDEIVLNQKVGMNLMSVSLLRLQNGEIALFYLVKNSTTDCIPMVRFSTDDAKSWSEPYACISDKKGYFVLNNSRVIQLKNGRLLMAVQLYNILQGSSLHKGGLWGYYSDDNGRNWKSTTELLNPDGVVTQEPGVTELKNGDILMNIRSNAGVQYISYSKNNGVTWSAAERSTILSPLSPATIKRIPSTQDLLLVWNNNGVTQQRTPLTIALSKDEGKTWSHIKTLEDDPKGTFCYTAIYFTEKEVLVSYSNWATWGTTIKKIDLNWIYQ